MFLRNLAGISLITVTIATQAFSAQTTFYVSPAGSDNNAGTLTAPFATLAKAQNAVRAINTAMTDDIVVHLRGGWYSLSSTLTFASADGGTNGHNVIYQAYTNEYPVISGGKQITGWTLSDATKNIWKATAPAGIGNRQLYVNCARAIRAHSGTGLPGAPAPDSIGYTTTDKTMQHWRNLNDVEFVFRGLSVVVNSGNPAWTERRCGVQSIAGTTITMKQPAWNQCQSRRNQLITHGPTDIENAYELLDKPGEWYLDRTANILYYKPKPGEDMSTAVVIAPAVEMLVSFSGTSGNPVRNMRFKGITFAHGTFLRPNTAGWPEIQGNYMYGNTSDGRTLGNVSCQAVNNFRFERCTFTHLGGCGLDLNNGTRNTEVVGCVFTDISANPIQIGNVADPARNDSSARDDSIRILNCYIHDSPVEYRGGEGIMIAYASNVLISHNEVCNTAGGGVSVGWGWGRASYMKNNEVAFNHIHHVLMATADDGNIYTLSPQPNSSIHDNYLHDNMNYPGTIYLDQGTCNFDVYRNVCENVGGLDVVNWININKMREPIFDIKVHDNFMLNKKSLFGGEYTSNNNQIISDSACPEQAREIMKNAGIQRPFRDILDMPCKCSIVDINTNKLFADKKHALIHTPEERWNEVPVATSLVIVKPFLPATGERSGVVRLIVKNLSDKKVAQGRVGINVFPRDKAIIKGKSVLSFKVPARQSVVKDFELVLNPGTFIVETDPSDIRTCRSRIKVYAELPLAKLSGAIDSVEQLLTMSQTMSPLTVTSVDGDTAARVSFALADTCLAFVAHVLETRLAPAQPTWNGSSIELYGAQSDSGKIGQVFLVPAANGKKAMGLYIFDSTQVLVPAIRIMSNKTKSGYDLAALVPFSLLKVDPQADGFLFEVMINATIPAKDDACRYFMLFRSTNAYTNASYFVKLVTQ